MSRDRIIHVALPSGHVYDIRIGSGALSALSSTARDLKECKRALVISDENVGPAYGKLVKKRLEEVSYRLNLQELMDRNIFELSGGEKQQIVCGSVYAALPSVIVMDEPSSNLDMESIRKLQKLIRMMKDEGKTVLISEHRLWYLEGIADRYVLLEDGRIRQEFTPEAAADLSLEKRKALGLRAVKREQLYELRPDMGLIKQKSTGLEIDGLQFSRQMRQVLNVPHLEIPSGAIVAVIGENGAGKSTLIKCLTGINAFDAGEIRVDGIDGPVVNHSTLDAQKKGISTVYQEVNLCPNLSVAENLFIGREPKTKLGTIDWKTMTAKSNRIIKSLDLDIDVTKNLEEYSLALQQMIAIARAVDMDCKVLILDEPTSSLDDHEVEKLFVLMRQLKEKGVAIVFVTHFLEQVYAVCDRITVLRNGILVGEYPIEELPRVKLVAAMMGKDFDDLAAVKSEEKKDFTNVPVVIDAQGMSHKGKIKPFDLQIHKGEVVGLTGLLGSGRSELARVIYGADKNQTGKLFVNGKEAKINAPIDAMNLGMGLLPDDRKAEGIIADLSVRENIILAMQAKRGMFKLLPMSRQNEIADKYIELLQIKTASRETLIGQLSGGNQQKVILARWLATDPEFLILDEPTRGIDVGTKTEIQKLVIELADQGKSLIFISSEIEEMLRTCSKLVVLRDGQEVGEITEELTQGHVMQSIAGGGRNE